MILDRGLTPDLCDIALRAATSGAPFSEQRRLLAIALRDHVSAQESEGKTKKCLTRLWVNPPAHAKVMIRWGADHAHLATDNRVLHLAALLATFPFAGTVATILGRGFALDGRVNPTEVRHRTAKVFGDKASVHIGARKVYTTLRHFGVISPGPFGTLVPGGVLEIPADLTAWLAHAVVLTRGAGSIGDIELRSAPEMFWASLVAPCGDYGFLTRHQEGGDRSVWAAP